MIIDSNHLRSFTLGDEDLERDLLRLFRENMPDYIAILENELSTGSEEFARTAHKIKGVARGLGAFKMASLAQKIEIISVPEDRVLALKQLCCVVLETETELEKLIFLQNED